MSKKSKMEFGFWAVCLLAGTSVLYGQWHAAARRHVQPEVTPVAKVEVLDLVMDVRPAVVPPVTKAEAPAVDVSPEIDTRLVARLLVDSVTQVESALNPRMVGSHGERGLMQIKAGTWSEVTRKMFGRRVSFDRAFEGKLNQQVGAAYLNDLQKFLARHQRLWRSDERSLLLACYNAGPERVRRAGFDLRRLPAHTQDYAKRASALHDALLADHHVDPARIRLALSQQQQVQASGS
jgi:hypothetical protein